MFSETSGCPRRPQRRASAVPETQEHCLRHFSPALLPRLHLTSLSATRPDENVFLTGTTTLRLRSAPSREGPTIPGPFRRAGTPSSYTSHRKLLVAGPAGAFLLGRARAKPLSLRCVRVRAPVLSRAGKATPHGHCIAILAGIIACPRERDGSRSRLVARLSLPAGRPTGELRRTHASGCTFLTLRAFCGGVWWRTVSKGSPPNHLATRVYVRNQSMPCE